MISLTETAATTTPKAAGGMRVAGPVAGPVPAVIPEELSVLPGATEATETKIDFAFLLENGAQPPVPRPVNTEPMQPEDLPASPGGNTLPMAGNPLPVAGKPSGIPSARAPQTDLTPPFETQSKAVSTPQDSKLQVRAIGDDHEPDASVRPFAAAAPAPAPLAAIKPLQSFVPPGPDQLARGAGKLPATPPKAPTVQLPANEAVSVRQMPISVRAKLTNWIANAEPTDTPAPSAVSSVAEITTRPVMPVIASDNISLSLQLTGQTAQPVTSAALTATATGAALPTPHNFESMVDRLVEAREAAQTAQLGQTGRSHMAIRHDEFGHIALRLESAAAGMKFALTNADPDFAPTVHAAIADRNLAERQTTGELLSGGNSSDAGRSSQGENSASSSSGGSAQNGRDQSGAWRSDRGNASAHGGAPEHPNDDGQLGGEGARHPARPNRDAALYA